MGERLNLPPPRGDQRSLAPQPSLPVLLFILMQFPLGCPLIGSEREPRANGLLPKLLPNSVLRAATEAYREARANEILSTNQHEVRHAGTEQNGGNRIGKPPPSATRPPLRTRSCRFLTRPTATPGPDRSCHHCAAIRVSVPVCLDHGPEKWQPIFAKNHASRSSAMQQVIAGQIRRAGLNDRAARSVKGVNNPRAVNAGRRHPADGARIRAFPREAAGRRVYNDALPGFYRVGVELRHLRFQRGNSVLHARPIAWTPQLRLCAQTH
jgi:hypothetical protein